MSNISNKTEQYEINKAKTLILSALNSEKYDARTMDGLVRETQLPIAFISKLLMDNDDLRSKIKVYPRLDKQGHVLMTTCSHFSKRASFIDKFVDFFATERRTIEDFVIN
jgi:hypothetical protein